MVLGQPSFLVSTANNGGISAISMSTPSGISVSGTKLYVVDQSNNRVLIWNTIPTVNQTAANLVLGQTTFTTNATGITSSAFNLPAQVVTNGSVVAVADRSNNRVLIWNTIPTTNGQVANVVLGQTLFTTNTVNTG